MALVGIVTSLEGVQTSLAQSFSSAGTNTISIIDKSFNFSFKGKKKTKSHPSIKYEDAELFKRQFTGIGCC